MELQYIIAIAAGGLFVLLFVIALCAYLYNKSKQRELLAKIYAMYNDKNLARIDYDSSLDDEASRIASASRADGQLTIDDVMFDAASPVDEGMEEITGNYKPD